MNSNKRYVIRIDKETGFSVLFALIWMQTILVDFLRGALLRIPVLKLFPEVCISIIFLVAVIFALPKIIKQVLPIDAVLYLLVVLIYLFDYLATPNNDDNLGKYASTFLISSLPLYFIGLSLDLNKLMKTLYRISIISIYAMILYKLAYGGGVSLTEYVWSEDMTTAYNILPHLMIVFLVLLAKPSIINILTSIFGFVFLISLGTRAPVLLILFFAGFYMGFIKSWRKPWIIRLAILVIVISVLASFDQIIGKLQIISTNMGMSSRFYMKLLEGNFFNSTGRSDIQNTVIKAIKANPIIGYGFTGDQSIAGTYSHNLILELCATFGVPAGLILSTTLIVVFAKALLQGRSSIERGFVLMLICCSFLKLFFSGTFLSEGFLFLLIGFCIQMQRNKEKARA